LILRHRERGDARVQAEHEGGDAGRGQIQMTRLLGADALAAQLHARSPVDMDRLDGRQRDQQRRVHRRAGALQDAGNTERLVGMRGQGDRAGAVRQHDLVTQTDLLRRATSAPITTSYRSSNGRPLANASACPAP
jgi:hypothetical protein